MKGHTPLVGTIGTFYRNTYRVIIDNHILPFMYDNHDGPASFMLQEDTCGPRRARSIATYLQSQEVTRMKWSAQSPDLNPIENVWGIMKQNLRKRYAHPRSTLHLFKLQSEMWNSLPN